MTIADRETQADITDVDAHDILSDCWNGHRKRNASQSERDDSAIQHFVHDLFLPHCLQQRNCGAS
jgi:hypothetical protein